MDRARLANTLALLLVLFASLLLGACSARREEAPAARPTPEAEQELLAFRERLTAEYVRFEKAQEPSDENGFTYEEYYGHLFDPELNPRMRAIPWLEAFEQRQRGTPAGLDALLDVLRYAAYDDALSYGKAPGVYALLLERYADLEKAGDACYLGRRCERIEDYLAFLERLIERSPHRSARGKAVMAKMLAYWVAGRAAEQQECIAELREHYADVIYKTTPLGELAERYLVDPHPEDALQVGCAAPDIAGYDVDGRPVRLGDHHGKVVALVFFGFW